MADVKPEPAEDAKPEEKVPDSGQADYGSAGGQAAEGVKGEE